MSSELAEKLLDAGLIQFGRFQVSNHPVPFRMLLDYLPAHPALLGQLAQAVSAWLPTGIDRVLVERDDLALGVALSLNSGIPLIYSREQCEDAAFDLVGAYNSGHRAVLVTTVLDNAENVTALAARARRVGLDVRNLLALISVRQSDVSSGLDFTAVLRFDEITQHLGHVGRIPAAHVQTTLEWLRT